jgi:predicted outer membrane protein
MSAVRIISSALFLALSLAAVGPASAESGRPFLRPQQHRADPKLFVRRVQRAVAFEGAASSLAMHRTGEPRIRSVARRLANHAGILGAGLRALALQDPSLPKATGLSASERQSLDQLRRLPEPNFGSRYLQAMRGLYEELLQNLRAFRNAGPAGPAKNFATEITFRAKRNLAEILKAQAVL